LTAYRVLVTGSRDWDDEGVIYGALDEVLLRCMYVGRAMHLIHGGAAGADSIAHNWAREAKVDRVVYEAQWREHGVYNPQAGLARNRLMVEAGADLCLAFIRNGSRGATHCANLAEEAGIKTWRWEV
jgi:hypothetical protein